MNLHISKEKIQDFLNDKLEEKQILMILEEIEVMKELKIESIKINKEESFDTDVWELIFHFSYKDEKNEEVQPHLVSFFHPQYKTVKAFYFEGSRVEGLERGRIFVDTSLAENNVMDEIFREFATEIKLENFIYKEHLQHIK